MATLSIDIETYSDVDIKNGVFKYVDTPNFEILLLAYAFDDEDVDIVDLTKEELPSRVREALFDPAILKNAFNAQFEITCLQKQYPGLSLESWECTSVLALYGSLPTGLDTVAKILHLPEQKDDKGKRLIQFFSVPCRPTKSNGGRTRNLPEHDPEKWELFKAYCKQDVVVEREIRRKLISVKPSALEHDVWLMDQEINRRGILIDRELAESAVAIFEQCQTKYTTEARELTGLENPNSVTQLLGWVESRGADAPNLTKATVEELRSSTDDAVLDRVLEIRQQLGKTSVKKYTTMLSSVCEDGRVKGLYQFFGANRTGRWAGRIVQMQNLPRNYIKELDLARELVKLKDLEALELFYDDVPDILSQLIRTAFVAPKGHRFIISDYAAIEARVIAWLSGERWRNEIFAGSGKIYEASAAQMFHLNIEDVDKELRQKGKVAELALGYQGGPGALISMGALKQGLTEEELPDIVERWRKASPSIVKFWYDVDSAAKNAIKTGNRIRIKQGGITFTMRRGKLMVTLPSGRPLYYVGASIGRNRFDGESIVYKGIDQIKKKWVTQETYGGKLVENIVQAVARDCLAYAMLALTKEGYKIVGHIHDEVIIEAPYGEGSLEHVIEIMKRKLPWQKGLLLNAAGFESEYYMKD